jgi:hypothetical protein
MTPPDKVELHVLITACERRLGHDARVAKELRRLRIDRSAAALERAREVFDALPGEVRSDLARAAYRAASDIRRTGIARVARKFGLIGVLSRRR